MTRILKYFFFKIYSYSLSNGERDANWAMAIVSMFIIANIYTLLDIILIITNSKLPQVDNIVLFVAGGFILYLIHTLFLKDGQAQIILKDFQNGKTNRKLLNLFLMIYIILTIILFIYTGNIVRALNTN